MRFRDGLALVAMCLIWGFNFVVAKWAISGTPGIVPGFDGAPPFFFAFLRFAALSLVLLPWLRPIPKDWKRLIGAALCMGGLQYGLIFVGLQTATPSGMAIVLQLGVPFATLLSVVWLKEKLGPWRIAGTASAFAGVALVSADPAQLTISVGLVIGVLAALIAAIGMILVKTVDAGPIRLQAWIGLISTPPLLAATLLFEHEQIAHVLHGGWLFALALTYTVLLVNVFGHGVFFHLLKRYDAALIAPLTLLAPLAGVVFGITISGDPLGWRLILGGVITLAGVGLVMVRHNRALPSAPLAREEVL